MSHFSSKRLLQAQRVKLNNVKNKPALVSSTGKGRVNFRLINKRVYKPTSKQQAVETVITVTAPYDPVVMSTNKMRDYYDYNGTGGTTGFITVYNVAVGDTISFTDNGGLAYTGTVTAVVATKGGGRLNELTLSPAPTNAGTPQGNITITQP